LAACDLPLAVFHWTGTSLAIVDAWAARRRPVRPAAVEVWRGLLSDRRVAVAQARFLQFQDQVDDLVGKGNPSTVVASQHFRFLPPVGFLPLAPRSLIDRFLRLAGTVTTPQVMTTHPAVGLLIKAREEMQRVGMATRPATALSVATAKQIPYAAAYYYLNLDVAQDPRIVALEVARDAVVGEVETVKVSLQAVTQELVTLKAQVAALIAGAAPPAPPTPPAASNAEQQALRLLAAAIAVGLQATANTARGFDLQTFLGALPDRIGVLDRDSVDFLLQQSWYDEAIDLTLPASQRPPVDFYLIEDNIVSGAQPYVLFAKRSRKTAWLPMTGGSA
jgi:hypothetical protein